MTCLRTAREWEIEQKAADWVDALRRCREDSELRALSELEQLPIDPCAVAIQLGLQFEEVEEFSSDQIRGALVEGTIIRPARFSPEVRYTVAHEVGHKVLHGGSFHLRQKGSRLVGGQRAPQPEIEIEAERFAAALLMPRKLVKVVFERCYGGPIDGRQPNDDLDQLLNSHLSRMTPRDRARLVATVKSFGLEQFNPLVRMFDVSVEAMAIRLQELELVL
jgi:IrrE N-terminal-like domain